MRHTKVASLVLPMVVAFGGIAAAATLSAPTTGAQQAMPAGIQQIQATVEIISPNAPPAPRVELIPPPPPGEPAQVVTWRPGHWNWSNGEWAWTPGVYIQRPQPAAIWTPGAWEQRPNGWVWVEGHWQ